MTTAQQTDTLVASLKQAFDAGISYFKAEAESEARTDLWTPREVLCHMIYWHQATIDGIESVASGGEPHRIYASTDEMNARAVGRAAERDVPRLIEDITPLQERLVESARGLEDPDVTVLVRADGTEISAAQRLEQITHHWIGHLEELNAIL